MTKVIQDMLREVLCKHGHVNESILRAKQVDRNDSVADFITVILNRECCFPDLGTK